MIEVTYSYTPAMARDAMRHFLWRNYGGILFGVLIALAWIPWAAVRPELRWFSGLVAGLVAAWLRSFVLAYRAGVRAADLFSSRPFTLRLTAAGLEFDSESFRGFSPWSAYPLVVSSPRYLYLTRTGTSQPLVLPVAPIGPDVVSFLLARVREAGGRVRRDA